MNREQLIIETIQKLLAHLGVAFTGITVENDVRTKSLRFVIVTTDSLILIGENGARLLALNHLIKRMVEQEPKGDAPSFMVDVNDFQKKHIDEIRAKANMLAERARFFKSSVEMDPMSSYERMIVHSEFSDTPDIATESSGYGKDRHITLRFTESKTPSLAV
jgi:spoIIIJ-associated protein